MTLVIVFLYLIISVLLSVSGYNNYGDGLKIFFLSLLLTPLAGIIYLLVKRKDRNKIRFYHCGHCNYVFPVKIGHCPICEENGTKVKLDRYKSPHYLGEQIQIMQP